MEYLEIIWEHLGRSRVYFEEIMTVSHPYLVRVWFISRVYPGASRGYRGKCLARLGDITFFISGYFVDAKIAADGSPMGSASFELSYSSWTDFSI